MRLQFNFTPYLRKTLTLNSNPEKVSDMVEDEIALTLDRIEGIN